MKIKSLIGSLVLLAGTAFGQSQFSGGGGTGGGGSGTVGSCASAGNAYYAAGGTTTSCDTSIVDNGIGSFTLVGVSGTGLITTSGSFSTTSTAVSTFQNGTALAPSIVFANGNYGFFSSGAASICLGSGASNTGPLCVTTGALLKLQSGGGFCFVASATNPTGACETGVSRDSALNIDMGTGATGSQTAIVHSKRYTVNGATNIALTDFALSAGWGTTASIAITNASSKDAAATVTVTSAGTGQAANPTITFTFHDGAWAVIPACLLIQNGGNDIFGDITGVTTSGTVLAGTWNGTPTATKTYQFLIQCLGT
jgi:hypothetical protein